MPDADETRPEYWSSDHDASTEDYVPTSTHDDAPTEGFPGHVVLGTLGKGGMGVVYKTRQESLNRVVALKVILSGRRAGRDELIRFLAEAQSVAAIKHQNVVAVHEYGEADGRPYLVMEYLPGGSLADRLRREGKLDPIPAANLIARLARGVQAAHDQGIVHRDLKPGNVLFDAQDEPKVTDFGLAKRATRTDLTHTRAVMGTPDYMSPEQAQGKTKFVGPQADVYALGVILYQCLTGRRPFQDADVHVLLRRVIEDDPAPPSRHVRGLPRDLELIALKCLAKDPVDRYQTALALAEDLDRFVAGEPVSVRSAGAVERTVKWARRKPVLAAAYALAVAALVLFAFGASLAVLWRSAEGARSAAESAQKAEKQARDTAESARSQVEITSENVARFEYGRRIEAAHQEWRDHNRDAVQALLDGTRTDLRGWEWKYVRRLWEVDHIELKGHTGKVNVLAWSPDGSRLVTASEDKTSRVWDPRTGAQVLVLQGYQFDRTCLAWSPDGARIAGEGFNSPVVIWNARTGVEVQKLEGHRGRVNSIAWSPDGSRIAATTAGATPQVWDVQTGATAVVLKGRIPSMDSVSWSPDGSRLATGGQDGKARVWDARSGALVHTFGGQELPLIEPMVVSWSPDGSHLATASRESSIRMWDTRTGAEVWTRRGRNTGWRSRVSWGPDGTRLAAAISGTMPQVWDVRTGAEVLALSGHSNKVTSVAWSPDGSRIATGALDSTARVWDARTGAEILSFPSYTGSVNTGSVNSVAWSPDGTSLATSGIDDTARVWDVTAASEARVFQGHSGPVTSVAWSPDGSHLASASEDRTARVWDARTGAATLTLEDHSGPVTSVAWSPDGSRLATGSQDKLGRVWDARTGVHAVTFRGHTGPVRSVSWSPDGVRVATGGDDKLLGVWDARTGAVIFTLKGQTWSRSPGYLPPKSSGTSATDVPAPRTEEEIKALPPTMKIALSEPVASVAWSPDGSLLVSADNKLRVWDPSTREEVRALAVGFVRSVAWSPDGSRLAAIGGDNAARVWDARTGAEVVALQGHFRSVTSVAWSPDGSRLATGSDDKTARVWDAQSGAEVLTLKGHTDGLTSVAWSPDGSRLATASRDRTIRVWDARSGAELRATAR